MANKDIKGEVILEVEETLIRPYMKEIESLQSSFSNDSGCESTFIDDWQRTKKYFQGMFYVEGDEWLESVWGSITEMYLFSGKWGVKNIGGMATLVSVTVDNKDNFGYPISGKGVDYFNKDKNSNISLNNKNTAFGYVDSRYLPWCIHIFKYWKMRNNIFNCLMPVIESIITKKIITYDSDRLEEVTKNDLHTLWSRKVPIGIVSDKKMALALQNSFDLQSEDITDSIWNSLNEVDRLIGRYFGIRCDLTDKESGVLPEEIVNSNVEVARHEEILFKYLTKFVEKYNIIMSASAVLKCRTMEQEKERLRRVDEQNKMMSENKEVKNEL